MDDAPPQQPDRARWRSARLLVAALTVAWAAASASCATRGAAGPVDVAVIGHGDHDPASAAAGPADDLRDALVYELLMNRVPTRATWDDVRSPDEVERLEALTWPTEALAEATAFGLTHVVRVHVDVDDGGAAPLRVSVALYDVASGASRWRASATTTDVALVDAVPAWGAALARALGGSPRAPPADAAEAAARREAARLEREGLDALWSDGDHVGAWRHLDAALARDPARLGAALGRARVAAATERTDLAFALIERLRARWPDLALLRVASARLARIAADELVDRVAAPDDAPPDEASLDPTAAAEAYAEAARLLDHVARLEADHDPVAAAAALRDAGDLLAAADALPGADARWRAGLALLEATAGRQEGAAVASPHAALLARLTSRWGAADPGDALLVGAAGDAPPSARDCANATPLHRAAEAGDLPRIEALLAAGADLDARDSHAATALHRAIWRDRRPAAEALLAAGAALDVRDHFGRAALHVAVERGDLALVRTLTARGASTEARTRLLEAPLHLAAAGDRPDLVAALLDAGAAPAARDLRDRTPLHVAAVRGAVRATVALAAGGAPLEAVDADGLLPLHVAASADRAAVVEALVRLGADVAAPSRRGATALHLAAAAGHRGTVDALLAAGASPLVDDAAGASPLDLALGGGHAAVVRGLLAALASGPQVETVEQVQGAPRVGPALHRAVARDAPRAMIVLLLDAGVPVDGRDDQGRTPLMVAAASEREDLVEVLLTRGADPELTDASGAGAVHLAARVDAREVVALLLAARPGLVAARDGRGATPLHLAALAGSSALVQALLDAGADPALTTTSGALAAHYAAHIGETALATTLARAAGDPPDVHLAAAVGPLDHLRALVVASPEAASAPGPTGMTPLQLAIVNGAAGAVALLVDAGVDLAVRVPSDALDAELAGWSALDIARAVGDAETAERIFRRRPDLHAFGGGVGVGGGGRWDKSREQPLNDLDPLRDPAAPESPDESAEGGASRSRADARPPVVPIGAEALGIQIRERLLDRDVLRREVHLPHRPLAHADGALDEVAARCLGSHDVAAATRELELQRAVLTARTEPDGAPMALVLHNLGRAYAALGRRAQAAELLEAARRALADVPAARAAALEGLADLRALDGALAEAERLLRAAIALLDGGDHPTAWRDLARSSLANVLTDAGRYADAVALLEDLLRTRPDRLGIAIIANNLAVVLDLLGDHAAATARYESLLTFVRVHDGVDAGVLATVLNNVAFARLRDGRLDDARALAERALSALAAPPWGTRPHYARGRALLTLARVAEAAGDTSAAVSALARAEVALRAAYGATHGLVADALRRRAGLLPAASSDEAIELLTEALALTRVGAAPEIAWRVEDDLAAALSAAGRPRAAIAVGKLAVATLQRVRAALTALPPHLQRSYLAGRTAPYRRLAGLLVDAGRLVEAQLVLDQLKDEEHFAFTRRARASEPAPFLGREAAVASAASASSGSRASGGVDLDELAALKRWLRQFKRAVAAALLALDDDDELGAATIEARLQQLALDRLHDLRAFLEDPAVAGATPAFVQIFLADDKVRVLLTRAGRETKPYEIAVPARRVFRMVSRLRELMQDASSDPVPVARQLYDALVAPLRADLDAAGVDTLMVWLDGALRYVPLGALHDGDGWLVERFAVARYTAVTHSALKDVRAPRWRVAALGMSQAAPGFDALTGVPDELAAVVADPKRRGPRGAPTGAMDGRILLDADFTGAALEAALSDGALQAVHVASHYAFDPGGEAGSFLLLGDKERMSLRALRQIARRGRLDLLTFSACSTAVGLGALAGAESADDPLGLEVEGLADVVQKELAASVLATLWPVVDDSTVAFMRELYGSLAGDARLSKVAALAGVQRRMIAGEVRGARTGSLAHPRYWAPFVLMGNWL